MRVCAEVNNEDAAARCSPALVEPADHTADVSSRLWCARRGPNAAAHARSTQAPAHTLRLVPVHAHCRAWLHGDGLNVFVRLRTGAQSAPGGCARAAHSDRPCSCFAFRQPRAEKAGPLRAKPRRRAAGEHAGPRHTLGAARAIHSRLKMKSHSRPPTGVTDNRLPRRSNARCLSWPSPCSRSSLSEMSRFSLR